MTDINFRVRGYPMKEGEEFLRENFRTESEATSFFEDLQTEEDNIVTATPYPSIVLALEEFYNGEWTVKCKRLVRK